MIQVTPNEQRALHALAPTPEGQLLLEVLERMRKHWRDALEELQDDRAFRQAQGRARMLKELIELLGPA